MNEKVCTSIIVCFASAILSLVRLCFLPTFANVFKNNVISSVIHVIVCLFKTE